MQLAKEANVEINTYTIKTKIIRIKIILTTRALVVTRNV